MSLNISIFFNEKLDLNDFQKMFTDFGGNLDKENNIISKLTEDGFFSWYRFFDGLSFELSFSNSHKTITELIRFLKFLGKKDEFYLNFSALYRFSTLDELDLFLKRSLCFEESFFLSKDITIHKIPSFINKHLFENLEIEISSNPEDLSCSISYGYDISIKQNILIFNEIKNIIEDNSTIEGVFNFYINSNEIDIINDVKFVS